MFKRSIRPHLHPTSLRSTLTPIPLIPTLSYGTLTASGSDDTPSPPPSPDTHDDEQDTLSIDTTAVESDRERHSTIATARAMSQAEHPPPTQKFTRFGASYQEPVFSTVNPGLGCMLHIHLPQGSGFSAPFGVILGMSARLEARTVIEGGPIKALMRKMAGANFFLQKIRSHDDDGDALVAPDGIGDIAVVDMNDFIDLYIKKNSFLACSPNVRVVTRAPMNQVAAFSLKATGTGSLAITSYGGLFRLSLEEGEEYTVTPDHIVAWHSTVRMRRLKGDYNEWIDKADLTPEEPTPKQTPTPSSSSSSSSSTSATSTSLSLATVTDSFNSLVTNWRTINETLTSYTRRLFLPKLPFVVVRGPGDVYIQSRTEPILELSGISNSRKQEASKKTITSQSSSPSSSSISSTSAAAAAATATAVSGSAAISAINNQQQHQDDDNDDEFNDIDQQDQDPWDQQEYFDQDQEQADAQIDEAFFQTEEPQEKESLMDKIKKLW